MITMWAAAWRGTGSLLEREKRRESSLIVSGKCLAQSRHSNNTCWLNDQLIDWLTEWMSCCQLKRHSFFFFNFIVGAHVCMLSNFSCVWFCATLWTAALQAPLSMGFSRQEYWSELPCPPPGDLPCSGMEPAFLISTCMGRWVLYH